MSQSPEYHQLLTEKHLFYCTKFRPITWSAIISGALIAFGLTFLFHLLTLGVGFAIVATTDQGINTLTLNGFMWTLVGSIVILFVAGWKTGKLIKLRPMDSLNYPESTPMGPAAGEYHSKAHCCCYHGMTHGFLAWVLYLIISLLFTMLVAHAASVTFLKNSFLNIPLGLPQAITQNMNADQRNATSNQQVQANQQNHAFMNNNVNNNPQQRSRTTGVSSKTAEKASAEIIGIFLIFVFGAAACSLGSYLGVLCHRRCASGKMKNKA